MDKELKAKILEELGGIPEEIYDELVRALISQLHQQLPRIEQALAAGDFDQLAKIGHSLKGAAGNLRIYAVQENAGIMENSAKSNKDKQEISKSFSALRDNLVILEKEFGK